MIVRSLQVLTRPGKEEEFSAFFHETAIPLMKATDGIVSVLPGAPMSESPREFSFVMVWRDLMALKKFVGEDYQSRASTRRKMSWSNPDRSSTTNWSKPSRSNDLLFTLLQQSTSVDLHPIRHDQPRQAIQRPLCIPREIQPLRQLDLGAAGRSARWSAHALSLIWRLQRDLSNSAAPPPPTGLALSGDKRTAGADRAAAPIHRA